MNIDLDTVVFDKDTTVRDLVESQLIAFPELKDKIRRSAIGSPDINFECKFVLPLPVHLLKQVVREVIARGGDPRPGVTMSHPYPTDAEVQQHLDTAEARGMGVITIDSVPAEPARPTTLKHRTLRLGHDAVFHLAPFAQPP